MEKNRTGFRFENIYVLSACNERMDPAIEFTFRT